MDFNLVTPFGDRQLSIEMIEGQRIAASCNLDLSADKWQVLKDLRTCRHQFGLSDRAIAILSALLTFYKPTLLSRSEQLVVFPSNRSLCERAHGVSEPTLRRHLSALVKAGVLVRRDSPNGKRYARRGSDGEILRAFGFDLTPLLALSEEIHARAECLRNDELLKRSLREEITLLRRDTSKSLAYALESELRGPWLELETSLSKLHLRTDRISDLMELKELHRSLINVSLDVHNALEKHIISVKMNGKDCQNERHIQDSNTEYKFDSEISFRGKQQEENFEPHSDTVYVDRLAQSEHALLPFENEGIPHSSLPLAKTRFEAVVDLSTILLACPKISHCLNGGISEWGDLIEAAERASSYLDISPSAMRAAQNQLGVLTTAATVAAILERSDHIRSPGGYLRSLTSRDGFTPKPMLQALLNKSVAVGVHHFRNLE